MKRKIQATIYFLKDQFLNIYAHTAKVQGTFCVNHIAKDRAACCQYFLVKYNYGRSVSQKTIQYKNNQIDNYVNMIKSTI